MTGFGMLRGSGPRGVWSLLLVGLLSACDSAPGVQDPLARPPVVGNLEFSPRAISLDDLPPESRDGEEVVVDLQVSASAMDPDGDLAEVRFVVQAPVSSSEPIAEGAMTSVGGGRFGAEASVRFPAGLTGSYILLVYASDERGYLGNEVRGSIELGATGEPPVIESIEAPATVQRPAQGEPARAIQLIAVVSDPDGLANVARVEVRFNGGAPLLLCDDGAQGACNPGFSSGDAQAGDGRYTLTIQVESTNDPGTVALDFTATDRSGLVSETVSRTLTIE